MYRRAVGLIVAVVIVASALGCESEGTGGDESADRNQDRASVEVSGEGEEFEPPITTEQLPAGAWHCDMDGSVHYAAMEKADGRCPVCNMKLTEK